MSLPEELLEASGSVGYSSSDGEGEQEMATAGVGGGMEQQTEKTLLVDHGQCTHNIPSTECLYMCKCTTHDVHKCQDSGELTASNYSFSVSGYSV